jgi:imidazolonepropionase-like amidohydrolase
LQGGNIHVDPWTAPIEDGVLVIEKGRITGLGRRDGIEYPSELPVIDCSGLNIAAGFWNSHVHFTELKWENAAEQPTAQLDAQLQDALTRHGFTTVFDLSSDWVNTSALRARIESGEVPGPRIRSVGEGMIPEGAAPAEGILEQMGWMDTALPEVKNPRQAAEHSQNLVAKGVDGIKLFASGQGGQVMAEGAIEVAVEVAHRKRLPVFVHPNSNVEISAAVGAGVDVLVHTTPQSGAWDEALLREMITAEIALTPTLTLWPQVLRGVAPAERAATIAMALEQLGSFHRAGGTVLFGTDLGAVHIEPVEEYVLMAGAGLGFADILASLTTTPAQRFDADHELGRIAPGHQADLVIFGGNPERDIRVLADVRYTIRAGEIIYRGSEAREP